MTLSPICIGFLFLILRSTLVFGFQRLSKTPWASRHRIDRTSIPLEQEQREHSRWFLGMVLDSTLLYFLLSLHVFQFSSQHGFIFIGFLFAHILIVEPVYYGYHRLLHSHRYLYKHHHIIHHLSVVVQPITSYTFTFLERLSYTLLFSLPAILLNFITGISLEALFVYYLVFDALNSLGHLNTEIFPDGYQQSFLKWVLYTPSFHRQHHKRYIKNYCLFMPIFDKLGGTVCPHTEEVFGQAKQGYKR